MPEINNECLNKENIAKVKVIEHPLISHSLTKILNKETAKKEFTKSLQKIANLMTYQIFLDLPLEEHVVATPVADKVYHGKQMRQEIVLVPVLRAGIALLKPFEEAIQDCSVAFAGFYRDEKTLAPQEYYFKYPNIENHETTSVYVLDPAISTGGTVTATINKLKASGVKNITIIGILGEYKGINHILSIHPDVKIYLADLSKEANEGDTGDRVFQTL